VAEIQTREQAINAAKDEMFAALSFYVQEINGVLVSTSQNTLKVANMVDGLEANIIGLDLEDKAEAAKRERAAAQQEKYKQKETVMEQRESISAISKGMPAGISLKGEASKIALEIAKIAGVLSIILVPQVREQLLAFLEGFLSSMFKVKEQLELVKKAVLGVAGILGALWTLNKLKNVFDALYNIVNLAVVTATALGFIKTSADDIEDERARLKKDRENFEKEKKKLRDKKAATREKIKSAKKGARAIAGGVLSKVFKFIPGLGLVLFAVQTAIDSSARITDAEEKDESLNIPEIVADEAIKNATIGFGDLEKTKEFAKKVVQKGREFLRPETKQPKAPEITKPSATAIQPVQPEPAPAAVVQRAPTSTVEPTPPAAAPAPAVLAKAGPITSIDKDQAVQNYIQKITDEEVDYVQHLEKKVQQAEMIAENAVTVAEKQQAEKNVEIARAEYNQYVKQATEVVVPKPESPVIETRSPDTGKAIADSSVLNASIKKSRAKTSTIFNIDNTVNIFEASKEAGKKMFNFDTDPIISDVGL